MMADQSATPFGTPWESMRGSWTTDYNNSLTLIRAPIDHVVDALADRTERWERDVLGRDIVAHHSRLEQSRQGLLTDGPDWLELLNHGLRPGWWKSSAPWRGAPTCRRPTRSRPSLRDLKRDDISNIWAFTHQFLVDHDAFDPGIDFTYFLGAWRADR